ncbi:hypothetical protein OUZ56_004929 [Daphnia magna]|uniref:Uncharacterized protein n=1 Tax=Daphnia magna TaxID=35525 RepID=A0ABQ9YRB9_9CRUS|nr:hypothetical protein OUZ56_004929 [Daphnia magna]
MPTRTNRPVGKMRNDWAELIKIIPENKCIIIISLEKESAATMFRASDSMIIREKKKKKKLLLGDVV